MKCNIKYFVTLLLLTFTSFGFSQEMKVTGTVYDSTGVKPAVTGMVMAVRMKDSVLLGFDRTWAAGKFELESFEIDTFSLIIDHPGLDENIYYVFGHTENTEIYNPS